MSIEVPGKALQLTSLVRADQTLELSIDTVDVPTPGPDEVLIRVEASPINPSDLGGLLSGADMSAATMAGTPDRPVVTAPIPDATMRAMAGRVGMPLAAGSEGAGTVVAAGSSPAAQALLGKTVAVAVGSGMYSQYRSVKAALCLELPEGTTATDGASSFVNPLTVLGFVENMRLENHTAIVHTAAASNLGQMLIRLCLEEEVPLVNIVRSEAQGDMLRAAGATYVCNSTSPTFMSELTDAIRATKATIAFDAVRGGNLTGQILSCMEAAADTAGAGYSRYGSTTHKQVYIYGGLDTGPAVLAGNFGMAWGVGGWLLGPFLQRIGMEDADRLRRRVAANLKTTFASSYTEVVSLSGALQLEAINAYTRRATGQKYLVTPNR